MTEFLYRILCGFFLGLSVFAPGISGSVVAIAMGIYHDLIEIASDPFKRLRQNIYYCIPLGVGAAISAVLFVIVFKYLFDAYEKATYLLFVGLIAGNLPAVRLEIKKYTFKKLYVLGGVIAFVTALAPSFLTVGSEAGEITSGLPLLAASGVSAGAAAFIPGLSVSMILIVFGVYNQIIYAAESFLRLDLTYFFPFTFFALCAVAGIMLTSRAIKAVFEKFPGGAHTIILGFLSGSMISILVQCVRVNDSALNWVSGSVMAAAGLGVSLMFLNLGGAAPKPPQGASVP